ncbi:F-box protein SKIP22-like [Punica granatum]|uniref:F-box domain-containing protein n=2 Tax=Punica granatum TaxID=22663 RepID=A0A218X2U7_PUNGR|nr:F-box protein SKIP22-like [Punica granatum]OWM79138.1 hypothetical protein CDL15_Pgr003309 [Punica granatum]PKI49264.1 hypothetical protein CRG98_030337 [Punica granatum]
MKLRLRSLESKETLKLEVHDECPLRLLKQILISTSSSSVHLSLNRRDELGSSAPGDGDSLKALGVTSGDLIYYSLNPNAFAFPAQQQQEAIPTPAPSSSATVPCAGAIAVESEAGDTLTVGLNPMASDSSAKGENLGHRGVDFDMEDVGGQGDAEEQSQSSEGKGLSELHGAGSDAMDVEFDVCKHSVPYFLRRVLREELGKDEVEHRLLVIAIHAVMLESGFVGFNSVTQTRADGFHLPDQWPSPGFSVSLLYSLPELLADGSNEVESVNLKIQSIGHYLTVYGSLAKGKSGLYRICLDEYRFAPTIDLMWANCDKKDGANYGDSSRSSYPNSEVFEFWKVVKDGLTLPLLIDLCERANLPLPSCLMRLPTELKLQILELLDIHDLLQMALVSKDFGYLLSHDDFWKQKFLSEFGDVKDMQDVSNWKLEYLKRKRDKISLCTSFLGERQSRWIRPVPFQRMLRDPVPLGFPRIIGGDHDWLPGLGPPSLNRHGGFPRLSILRTAGRSCTCNLGRLNR